MGVWKSDTCLSPQRQLHASRREIQEAFASTRTSLECSQTPSR